MRHSTKAVLVAGLTLCTLTARLWLHRRSSRAEVSRFPACEGFQSWEFEVYH